MTTQKVCITVVKEVVLYIRVATVYNVKCRQHIYETVINHLIATLTPQSNSDTVIGTLAVDGWAVTFGTARPAQAPPRCTKCNIPPINGQRTSVFDVSL